MEVFYQRNFNESYMILEGEAPEAEYEEEMLRRNQIQSLLTFYSMEVEGKYQLWYEITGKESLKDYLEQQPLTMELLDEIITYLAIAYQEISSYLLKQQHIYLNPETIYIERSQKKLELKLCYCPMQQEAFCTQFRQVMEYIISIVDHQEEQLTRVCYEMYEQSVLEDYNLQGIAALLEPEHQAEVSEDLLQMDSACHNVVEDEMTKEEELSQVPKADYISGLQEIWRKIISYFKSWYGEIHQEVKKEALVFEPKPKEIEPTTLLREGDIRCVGRLQYVGDKEEDSYVIQQDVFRIGSRDQHNDANLQSEAVSRHHGKITRREDGYYLEDLNSTNGTFLNGELLSYHQAVKLSANDQIQFADVPYTFI